MEDETVRADKEKEKSEPLCVCPFVVQPLHVLLHEMNRLCCAAKRIPHSLPHSNLTTTATTSASAPTSLPLRLLQLNLGHVLGLCSPQWQSGRE